MENPGRDLPEKTGAGADPALLRLARVPDLSLPEEPLLRQHGMGVPTSETPEKRGSRLPVSH